MINYIRVNFLLFNFQPSSRPEQTIFHVHNYRLDCQTSLSTRDPRSDHYNSQEILPEIRPPRPNATPNQQTRPATRSDLRHAPPYQTTRSDRPTRTQATILDYSASNQHSTPNLLKWYRSGAFLMGWVKGGI